MLLALNVHVLSDTNFMFVLTPASFLFLPGQPHKKGVPIQTKSNLSL